MDAVKFLREWNRMSEWCNIACEKCPLSANNNEKNLTCSGLRMKYPEDAVRIVKEWSKVNPKKKRQSELLKLCPKAVLDDSGIVCLSPCTIEEIDNCDYCKLSENCIECSNEFWLEEIEEDGDKNETI